MVCVCVVAILEGGMSEVRTNISRTAMLEKMEAKTDPLLPPPLPTPYHGSFQIIYI
jgi:hypothetical protein